MYCSKCGTQTSDEWKVCPNCGTALKSDNGMMQKDNKTLGQPSQTNFPEVKRPSQWQYIIGAVIIVVTFIVAISLFFYDMFNTMPASENRFVVPGQHEILFSDTGEYTIFYEYQSSLDGKVYSTAEELSGMFIYLENRDTSAPVLVTSTSGNFNYEIGSRAGKSVLEFEIDEPGTYVLTADYDHGTGPDVVIAIGQFDIWGNVLQTVIIILCGFIVGAIIVIRAFLKRRKIGKQTDITPVNRIFC